jgi:hypothetical protein
MGPVQLVEGEKFVRVVKDDMAWFRREGTENFKAMIPISRAGRAEYIKPEPPRPEELPPDPEPDVVWAWSGARSIVWTKRGILVRWNRGDHIEETPVIAGHVRPIRQIDLDGDIFFEVHLDRIIVTTAVGLLKILDAEAKIHAHGPVRDVLPQVLLHFAPDPIKAHPTFGVYDAAGALEICSAPMPVQKEQEIAWRQIGDVITRGDARPDEWGAYAELLELVHPYEVLPAMGMGAIAPFAFTLRKRGIIVPHVWHYSTETGLGKSLIAEAFSQKLWGRPSITGDALNSNFRFAALLDGAGVPLWVEEGEKLDVKLRGADLKAVSEREIVDKRGTQDLGMITYSARSVLVFTGNAFPFESSSVLARFVAPRFDGSMQRARQANKDKADALRERLAPIGGALVRSAVAATPRTDELLARIRMTEGEIRVAYPGTFQDVRRAQVWAVVYAGLEMWSRAFAAAGVSWRAPTIPVFVHDVVLPIERYTYEGVQGPIDAFRSWWKMWRVRFRDKHDVPRGRDEIWCDEDLDVGGVAVSGTWVTKAVLEEYNHQAAPDMKVASLPELARSAASAHRIPHHLVLDPAGGGKVKRIGMSTQRAAFVPESAAPEPEEESAGAQTTLEGSDGEGGSRVYGSTQKDRNIVTSPEANHEEPVTMLRNSYSNTVTSNPSIEQPQRYGVTVPDGGSREAQDPDYMTGLARGLELARVDPHRPASWAVKDLEKELKARGHVPDPTRLLAGVQRGLEGKQKGEGVP